MGIFDGLKKALQQAGEQLTSSSPKPQGFYFTPNFQQKAKSWGLTEREALDVYNHGQEVRPNMKVQKYNGYELCIYLWSQYTNRPDLYLNHLEAGKTVITYHSDPSVCYFSREYTN